LVVELVVILFSIVLLKESIKFFISSLVEDSLEFGESWMSFNLWSYWLWFRGGLWSRSLSWLSLSNVAQVGSSSGALGFSVRLSLGFFLGFLESLLNILGSFLDQITDGLWLLGIVASTEDTVGEEVNKIVRVSNMSISSSAVWLLSIEKIGTMIGHNLVDSVPTSSVSK